MNTTIPGAYIAVKQTIIDKLPLPPRISGYVTACLRKEISKADLDGDNVKLFKKIQDVIQGASKTKIEIPKHICSCLGHQLLFAFAQDPDKKPGML
jgi:hypothetical protein